MLTMDWRNRGTRLRFLSSSSNRMELACSHGGRKILHAASGKSLCASPFLTSTWITFATIHPTGQSKLHDQFQHQDDSYLRVWRSGSRGICGCFCNPTIQVLIGLEGLPQEGLPGLFLFFVFWFFKSPPLLVSFFSSLLLEHPFYF